MRSHPRDQAAQFVVREQPYLAKVGDRAIQVDILKFIAYSARTYRMVSREDCFPRSRSQRAAGTLNQALYRFWCPFSAAFINDHKLSHGISA